MTDPNLENIGDTINQLRHDTIKAYELIRALNQQGYGYTRLEQATGLTRNHLQRIMSGLNPKLDPKR